MLLALSGAAVGFTIMLQWLSQKFPDRPERTDTVFMNIGQSVSNDSKHFKTLRTEVFTFEKGPGAGCTLYSNHDITVIYSIVWPGTSVECLSCLCQGTSARVTNFSS